MAFPQLNLFLQNIEGAIIAIVGFVFLICIAIAGLMRMLSFGNERRVAVSNMALTAAVVGLVIIVIAVVLGQFLIRAIPGATPGVQVH